MRGVHRTDDLKTGKGRTKWLLNNKEEKGG